jgi:glycosyl transferase family 87
MRQKHPKIDVAIAILLSTAMWLYVNKVLATHQRVQAAARQTPRGNLSDLYPRWLGSRELLLHHRDPYSAEITREIQIGYYGRALDPSRPGDPKDQQAFAYPVYVAILLAPTVNLSFEPLRILFDGLLIAFTAASVWFWMKAMRWTPPAPVWLVIVILVLGSFPAVQGIKLDQLTLLVVGLLSLSALFLVQGRLFTGGVVLAIATIKPQLVGPLAICLLFWAMLDWRRRWFLAAGFAAAMGFLLGVSEIILPGWLPKFWLALHQYVAYTGGISLIDKLLSRGPGLSGAVAIVAILLALVWRLRQQEPGSREFSILLAKILAATFLLVPGFASYNQLLLLPAVLLTAREWNGTWRSGPVARAMLVATVIAVGWPWVAATVLTVIALGFSANAAQSAWAVPLYSILAVPLVLLLDLALLDGNTGSSESSALPQLALGAGKR